MHCARRRHLRIFRGQVRGSKSCGCTDRPAAFEHMPHVVWRPEVSERSDSKFFNAHLSILSQRPYSCRVRNEPFFFPSVYHELFLSYHFLSVVYPRSSVATNRRQTVTVSTPERRFSFHQPSNRSWSGIIQMCKRVHLGNDLW